MLIQDFYLLKLKIILKTVKKRQHLFFVCYINFKYVKKHIYITGSGSHFYILQCYNNMKCLQ